MNELKNECQQSVGIETCMLNRYNILIFSTWNILIVVFSNLPFGLNEGISKIGAFWVFFSNVYVRFVAITYSTYGLDKVENSSLSILQLHE